MQSGYLSPSGEWHPCDVFEHSSYAGRVFGVSDSILEKRGWVKISRSMFNMREQKIYWDLRHTLTPEQVKFLRPYFEENDIPVDELALRRFRKETE